MTDDEAKELARLEAAATPGPWTPNIDDDIMVPPSDQSDTRPMVSIVGCHAGGEQGAADAAFIAAARNALPRLLAEREALRALVRESRRDHECGDMMVCASFVGPDDPPAACDCGADAWNERIDQAIGGGRWTEDGRYKMTGGIDTEELARMKALGIAEVTVSWTADLPLPDPLPVVALTDSADVAFDPLQDPGPATLLGVGRCK